MTSISCIIIEDEPLAMGRIKRFVKGVPSLQLLHTFENGHESIVFLRDKTNVVDIIFLDINIGEITGIQLLEAIAPDSEVIITTAYDAYALKGYELNVTDYLLKPFSFERFSQAVDKAKNNIKTKAIADARPFIFIKTEHRFEKVFLAEILYIEGMRDYRKIHTTDKKIMTLQTFSDLENEIPPGIICRVHKSYMVSISKIDSVEKDRVIIKDVVIPVSDTYKKQLLGLIR